MFAHGIASARSSQRVQTLRAPGGSIFCSLHSADFFFFILMYIYVCFLCKKGLINFYYGALVKKIILKYIDFANFCFL